MMWDFPSEVSQSKKKKKKAQGQKQNFEEHLYFSELKYRIQETKLRRCCQKELEDWCIIDT